MWFALFCGGGQSPASEVCSCDAPEAAVRRTGRAVLDPGSGASPLSFFPLSQEIFQPQALPLACSFPTHSAGEHHNGSTPSSQKTMSLSTISRGRGWSPQFPGLWKDFLLFTCPHERSLVHGARSLRLKCDSSSKEWLWAYGRGGFCHRLHAWPQARRHLPLDFLSASFNSSLFFWTQILVIRGQLSPRWKEVIKCLMTNAFNSLLGSTALCLQHGRFYQSCLKVWSVKPCRIAVSQACRLLPPWSLRQFQAKLGKSRSRIMWLGCTRLW